MKYISLIKAILVNCFMAEIKDETQKMYEQTNKQTDLINFLQFISQKLGEDESMF